MKTLKKKLFTITLLVLLSVAFLASFWQVTYAATLFSDEFESGDLSAWTGSSGTPSASTEQVYHGTYSAYVPSSSYIYKTYTGQDEVYFRFYVRWSANPIASGYYLLGRIGTSATTTLAAAYVMNVSGTMKWRFMWANSTWTANYVTPDTPNPSPLTWYCVEFRIKRNTANGANMWVNDVLIASANATTVNVQFTYALLYYVAYSTGTTSVYYDCAEVATTKIGLLEDTDAPTASNPNTNQTVATYPCSFNVTVNDVTANNYYIFGTNNTGTWINETALAFSSTPETISTVKTLNATIGILVQWNYYFNDTLNNWGSLGIQNLTITSSQAPSYDNIGYTTPPTSGQPCDFSARFTALTDLSKWTFATNNTGSWVNETWTAFTANPDWANITKTLHSTIGIGVSFQWRANNTENIIATTPIYTLTTTGNYTLTIQSNPISASYAINGTLLMGVHVYAASGWWWDIQQAVNNVTYQGGIGTVHIPLGRYAFINASETWPTSMEAKVNIPAGINLVGYTTDRGTVDGITDFVIPDYGNSTDVKYHGWKTILYLPIEVGTFVAGETYLGFFFRFYARRSDPFAKTLTSRMSDIFLEGYRFEHPTSTVFVAPVVMDGVTDFRIDHCDFRDLGWGAYSGYPFVHYGNTTYGVVDHCNIINDHAVETGWGMNEATAQYGLCIGGTGTWSLTSWNQSYWIANLLNVLGHYTILTTVIENNRFSKWRHDITANNCAHYILRHNYFFNDLGWWTVDAHARGESYNYGTRAVEIYENTFVNVTTAYNPYAFAQIQCGASLIYNNTVSFSYNQLAVGKYASVPYFDGVWYWDNDWDLTPSIYGLTPPGTVHAYALGGYSAFTFPHPLATGGIIGTCNDTLSLTGLLTYEVTVPSSVTVGALYYEFLQWEDASTNLTRTVTLTTNITITVYYTLSGYSITVSVVSPTTTIYETGTILVSFSALGGTIDVLWWNCKNDTAWVYVSNQTYTTPTYMIGFAVHDDYVFYAWANNTDGYVGYATVVFSVTMVFSDVGDVFYFRGDSHTVNTLTAYILGYPNTDVTRMYSGTMSGSQTVIWGFKVWLIHEDGDLTLLTSTYVGLLTRSGNGQGKQNGTWTPPATYFVIGFDAIKVTVYMKIGSGDWTVVSSHVTEQLLKKQLTNNTWTFSLYTYRQESGGITTARTYFGDSTHDSHISGVEFTEPNAAELDLYHFQKGNFFTAIMLPYVNPIGSLCYGLFLLIPCITIYKRTQSANMILLVLILFGGAGGLFSMLIPDVGVWWAWIVAFFAFVGLLYRALR